MSRTPAPRSRLPARLAGAAALAAGVAVAYVRLVRPWHLRWGATDAEARAAMPGDDLIAEPTLVSTRAVGIDAPPSRVWPWIVQIGRGRGGFYSHDRLENLVGLGIHSADRILEEHQVLRPGDAVSLGPGDARLEVERVEPDRLLVLREPGGGWTWTFLIEGDDGRSRLIARNRWTTAGGTPGFRLYMALIDPVAFVMERRMLLGVRERAEGPA